MKVSVAMTTYNGKIYVETMLNSMLEQTYSIDEVIICEDVSTDDTVEIVRDFIAKNDLCNWKLITNMKNKGFIANFNQAIELQMEILFSCVTRMMCGKTIRLNSCWLKCRN